MRDTIIVLRCFFSGNGLKLALCCKIVNAIYWTKIKNGMVVEIHWSSLSIKGNLNPEFGALRNLTELNLDYNMLTGSIPKDLSALTNLIWLDLSHNQLTGSIPQEFGALNFLRGLYLNDNFLEGSIPTELESLVSLQRLHLNGNNFEGIIPEGLLRKQNLRFVFVPGNPELQQPAGFVSLEVPQFPMFVVSRDSLLQMDRLEKHEVALQSNHCRELKQKKVFEEWWTEEEYNSKIKLNSRKMRRSYSAIKPSEERMCKVEYRENIVFFSHRWLCPHDDAQQAHPDDPSNSKLQHIKRLLEQHHDWKLIWIDFLCVPQDNLAKKEWAINSLPHYVKCCGTMVTLCGTSGEAQIDVYSKRGWCRLEQLSTLIPIPTPVDSKREYGDFYDTKLVIAKRGQTSEEDSISLQGVGHMHAKDLNPLEGVFFQDEDRPRIKKCVKWLCEYLIKSNEQSLIDLGNTILSSATLNQTNKA